MAKLIKQVKAVSNNTASVEPVSAPTNTDEPADQDEATTDNHSAGSNEASGLIVADDYVPAIKEAAALLTRTELDGFKESLRCQIALGKLLNQAKAVCEHGNWKEWFEAKKFAFSLRKAQRAMRFANFEPELLAWAKTPELALLANDGDIGVFEADSFVAELEEAAEAKAAEEAAANAKVDELADTISHLEQDNRDRLLVRQLKTTTTSRISEALIEALDAEQFANLSEQLNAHQSHTPA
jgi:hypothetical protein